jgi:hypothetical protein
MGIVSTQLSVIINIYTCLPSDLRPPHIKSVMSVRIIMCTSMTSVPKLDSRLESQPLIGLLNRTRHGGHTTSCLLRSRVH